MQALTITDAFLHSQRIMHKEDAVIRIVQMAQWYGNN